MSASQPFIGQIVMTGFTFAPSGWALCNGQLIDISQNDALFALIGTTYGGDGQTTFALPNLQSRVPVHMGQGLGLSSYVQGQMSGVESVTLLSTQMPQHTHSLSVSGNTATNAGPGAGLSPSQQTGGNLYAPASAANITLHPASISVSGGNQPHNNLQPYLCVNFIISLYGIFPSQN